MKHSDEQHEQDLDGFAVGYALILSRRVVVDLLTNEYRGEQRDTVVEVILDSVRVARDISEISQQHDYHEL